MMTPLLHVGPTISLSSIAGDAPDRSSPMPTPPLAPPARMRFWANGPHPAARHCTPIAATVPTAAAPVMVAPVAVHGAPVQRMPVQLAPASQPRTFETPSTAETSAGAH